MNNIDKDIIYGLISIIKKNYYTTYLVLLSRKIEELIENIHSLQTIMNFFKPYIKITDKTRTNIKEYLMIPLITSRLSKNITTLFHYSLIRKHTRYPYRELRYDEFQALNDLQSNSKRLIIIGKSLNIYPEIDIPLSIDNLYRHTMITGSSGSGKTTTAKKILRSLIDNDFDGHIVVLDWHREYNKLKLNNSNIKYYTPGKPTNNNLSIPSVNCNVDIETSIQVIESTLQLTPPQSYLLIKIIEKLCKYRNTLTFLDILDALEEERSNATIRSEIEITQALYRKLYTITRGQGIFLFSNKNNLKNVLKSQTNETIIIDLSTIVNKKLRIIYSLMIIKTIFEQKSLYNLDKPLIMILEETHNYVENNKLLDNIVSESRKYDLGFIIIEQSISRLSNGVIANTTNKIFHTTISPADLEKARQLLPHNYVNILPYLEVGEVVFMSEAFREPVIVKIT